MHGNMNVKSRPVLLQPGP